MLDASGNGSQLTGYSEVTRPLSGRAGNFRIADHSDTIASSSHLAVYRKPSNRKGPFRQDG
jgi:hypothetical protein